MWRQVNSLVDGALIEVLTLSHKEINKRFIIQDALI